MLKEPILGSLRITAALARFAIVLIACGCTPVPGGTDGDAATPGLDVGGCGESLYQDRTAVTADRTIWFGGQGGSYAFTYAPQCLLVAAGQTVTFSGAFAQHPLTPGIPQEDLGLYPGSPDNPIPYNSAGQTISVTLPQSGTFPYFCANHFAFGMIGAIRVR